MSSLTTNELSAIINIIEIASGRGAFRAHELSPVGAIVDRIAALLQTPAADIDASDAKHT